MYKLEIRDGRSRRNFFFGVIDAWDFILLRGNTVERPLIPRSPFNLKSFDETDCVKKIRFEKAVIFELNEILLFPGIIILFNGSGVAWEVLCEMLRRLATVKID